MKFYIIHAFFFNLLNMAAIWVHVWLFVLPSCFPLEEKHITIALYFILFAVSLIRGNLKKRNTDVVPGSKSSRTSFPGCLFSFSSTTKGFSGQVNTNSSYPKYLYNTKGTQADNLPLWRAMWPFRSRKQLWTTEGFNAGGDTLTCST